MTGPDQISSGIVLLSVAAIASGGHFLLRVSGGRVATNELQRTFFRAGHAPPASWSSSVWWCA